MLFHAFCYIVTILLVLWLRSESKPQQFDTEQAVQEHFEQLEVQPEMPNETPQSQPVQPSLEAIASDIWQEEVPTPKPAPKPHSKKLPQNPQPMSVGAAAIDYSQMNVEQLRKECTLQKINWRTGGDYGKPMKKSQMLAALK